HLFLLRLNDSKFNYFLGHGLFPKQECSPTSDTFCEALNGFFCKLVTSSGCTQAEKHSVCKTGQRIKEPETNRRDTVCEDCQEGYFSSEGVTCSLWAKCSETQTKVEERSSVSDVVHPSIHLLPLIRGRVAGAAA
uniref:TNFR-Cys domain-containing protein n=1 Tax=Kryptolebias marmoratus TaxID=37003 RepID=A0A3Q3ALD8_KRYMA